MRLQSLTFILWLFGAMLTTAALTTAALTTAALAEQIPITTATATQFSDQFPPSSAHDGLTNESDAGGEDGRNGPGPHTDTYWLSADGLLSDTITFDLDLTSAPGGWEVTSVDIVNTSNSGWNDRETDEFGLEVFDSSAGTWITIVPDGTPIEVYWPETKSVDVSGVSHITQVRVNVANDPDLGPVEGVDVGTGLNEVRIFGVPEPSGLVLLFSAVCILFGLARRRG